MKPRVVALRCAAALVLGALAFEGALRFLAFSDAVADSSLARAVRRPERFADMREPMYWYLQDRFRPTNRRDEAPPFDATLGWRGSQFTPEFAHEGEASVGGRELVILYGDSYAQCTTDPSDCFQGLLADSPLAGSMALLNYGVGGYGLDQIALLVEATLPRLRERNPIVVVTVMLDDDLDRCVLDFRCWPKPRFRIVDGELQTPKPTAPSIEEHWRQNPAPATSLAWRLVSHALAPIPTSPDAPRESEAYRHEVEELSSALLRGVEARLRASGLRHFYLLLEYRDSLLMPGLVAWRKKCVVRTLDELGAPWIATRQLFIQASKADQRPIEEYFGTVGRNLGHFNVRGNEVAFRALLDGLARHAGVEVGSDTYAWLDSLDGIARPRGGNARTERGTSKFGFTSADASESGIVVHCDAAGDARLRWRLGHRVQRFACRATASASAELVWTVDGTELARHPLASEAEPLALELALGRGAELSVDIASSADCSVTLAAPVFD